MSQELSESVSFKLDKAHFYECYEQSAAAVNVKDYYKALVLGFIGVILFFIEAEHYYIPFFIFCLSVVELLAVKYRKTWWVWRQLISKSANSIVKLVISDTGITSISKYHQLNILWTDVLDCKVTDKGIILFHRTGKNYLSQSYLGEQLVKFIIQRIQQVDV
jgi:mRNA-degrading endonuclease YafQ of YafQ-DinJ toxin-antitoxin module